MPRERIAAPVSLQRLIWRSYFTSALVPVFFIELALIAAYFITNNVIREQNITTLQRISTEQLQYAAQQQAEHIGSQLASVASHVELLRMEGVVGLDGTIDRLTQQVLQLHLPWNGYGMLVGKRGTILALPTQGERDWGLKELTTFNLLEREDSRVLGQRLLSERQGLETMTLAERGKQVSWATVKGTDWKLLVVVDEAEIFAEAYALNRRVLRVGLGMIAGLILFYALFFAWLYQKVRRMSSLLAEPLLDLETMMQRIGQGEYSQPRPTYPILELQRTGEGLVQMGQALGQSNASLQQVRADVEQLNRWLEECILQRTREMDVANAALHQENIAKQALIQELQRTQSQLIQSEKLASMAQLASGIAHELKNPLNFISNLSEASVELSQELERTLRDRPQVLLCEVQDIIMDITQNAAIVYQHGMRADHIIRSMMEHARGRSGAFEPTDVRPLVEQYLKLTYAGERVRKRELEVRFVREFDPAVGRVKVMPQEMGRVLQNLIQNAIYAVSVKQHEVTRDAAPTITLRTRRMGDNVILQVEDNGPGIPKELQDRIFEPFFTTKPPGDGNTGLGLSLSYDIVKLHGGTLTVESEVGQFTRFTVSLPASEEPQLATAA